ncbi:DsbA family protein [Terrilactibacillus sp. BCM23-1]|uniref:ClpXP adapter protein SpxH n=1 Tax=Terrilactibacillus tamarindi TaxID=2599694 RepID=A0A6N8CRI3_9BACI|nr:DsbA family protein [Terrilactibacillus tamarindi]MTT30576.1 DsbA family protein [Terrilactibacillus tamarindi]
MNNTYIGSICEGTPGNFTCSTITKSNQHKRVEIYAFIDPLCAECWGLEPVIKRLHIEYGQYFTFRYLITLKKRDLDNPKQLYKMAEHWNKVAQLTGMFSDSDVWFESPPCASNIALAIKAAEFQGRAAGLRFLRRIREQIFICKKSFHRYDEFIDVAKMAKLNIEEFVSDMISKRPEKALLCDKRFSYEMEIEDFPTLVFFNTDTDEEGIKIPGRYNYDIYVQVLTEMLGETPIPQSPPSLEKFVKKHPFIATKELATIYNLSEQSIRCKMKKLKLKQIVEEVPLKFGSFWRYIN